LIAGSPASAAATAGAWARGAAGTPAAPVAWVVSVAAELFRRPGARRDLLDELRDLRVIDGRVALAFAGREPEHHRPARGEHDARGVVTNEVREIEIDPRHGGGASPA
jgi:hypothetical protein